jgi:DNA-binding CsgD family transcriptional regulator/tetratricopeptide (TPR) repeat protein
MTDTGDMELLEREPSLALLAGYAAEARRGEGRLVLLDGEAGVGKTALVERFQRDLPAASWSWGACDGLFTPRPLGPLYDLADQLGGALFDLCSRPAAQGADREELFRALLRQVSEPGALNVIVVEDIHWADEATMDLLRFAGRRLRDAPVLLIVTYRDDDLAAGDPLRVALGELARQRPTRRISLAALSADAVQVLASGSDLEPAALYRLTGGNPFYVTEVLNAGMTQVPASARDAVLARAAGLSGDARQLLEVAALTGARVEPWLLQATATGPPEAVAEGPGKSDAVAEGPGKSDAVAEGPGKSDAVAELLACGLLAADGAGDSATGGSGLRFRHEIARLAVEQAIPAHRRVAIHGRILAALRASGPQDDAKLAFHAEGAGDAAAVLRHAPAAARRAAELASHREAAAQLERALRFAAQAGDTVRAGLYDDLAVELALLDRAAEAAEIGQRALDLWRAAGDRLREGDTMRRLSCTLWHLCRGEDAEEAADHAVDVLESLPPGVELAQAYANLATQHMVRGRHQTAIENAQRAQATAGRAGAPAVISEALNTEAVSAAILGRQWTPLMDRALRIALDAGLQGEAGRAYCNYYATYCGQRRFAEAEPLYTAGLAYCDEHDITTYATFMRSERTGILEKTGRWDEALALSREILEQTAPAPVTRLCPLTRAGTILGRRGDPQAWAYLDEAMAAAEGTGEPQSVVPVRLGRAEAHWLEGRTADALREAELADDMADTEDAWMYGAVAAWLRRTGSARPVRAELAEPYQHQVSGHGEKAAQLWTDLGCPYEAALARLDAPDEAALREALATFTALGAPAAARLARQRLRALGVRAIPVGPRSATRDDPFGLTRREREILAEICAGQTNAAIAAKLFISAKTVDHHVSAVLAKLGAPNRNAAAAQAARQNLF